MNTTSNAQLMSHITLHHDDVTRVGAVGGAVEARQGGEAVRRMWAGFQPSAPQAPLSAVWRNSVFPVFLLHGAHGGL